MDQKNVDQLTINIQGLNDDIFTWLEAFLLDKKVMNLSPATVQFYEDMLKQFFAFCDGQAITRITDITPDNLRRYMLFLAEQNHNPGGIHAAYRAVKVFLNWWEAETEPEGWKNPIRKVKAPKMAIEPIQPVEVHTIELLLSKCGGNDFIGIRDKALLLFLLDTGARAAEVCALNLEDVDLLSGSILIKSGKGRKPRTVYLGQKARRALRAYLKHWESQQANKDYHPLWLTDDGQRLTYWGMNQILRRRALAANVKKPGLHDFRRAFALNFLRNSPGEIFSLQKLMGHSDLQILRRYLAQTDMDIQEAHRRGSPVDNSSLR